MKIIFTCVIFILITLNFFSCIRINQSERYEKIPQFKWYYNYTPTLTFNVTDTSYHKVYFLVRHTSDYKYKNLWLDVAISLPEDSTYHFPISLTLADDEKGWLGSGFNNLFETVVPWRTFKAKKTGEYKFTISQIMREEPLQHISFIGIRIE